MYVDKLDGRIDNSFYVQMSEQWKVEQDKLTLEIARHQTADRTYLDGGARLIELAHGARRLFAKQEPKEQRRLLNFVLSNSSWKNGELTPTFRQPFDLIAEVAAKAKDQEGDGALNSPEHPAWLGSRIRTAMCRIRTSLSKAAHAVVGTTPAYAATKGAIDALVLPRSLARAASASVPSRADRHVEFTKTEAGRDFALGMQSLKRLASPTISVALSLLGTGQGGEERGVRMMQVTLAQVPAHGIQPASAAAADREQQPEGIAVLSKLLAVACRRLRPPDKGLTDFEVITWKRVCVVEGRPRRDRHETVRR